MCSNLSQGSMAFKWINREANQGLSDSKHVLFLTHSIDKMRKRLGGKSGRGAMQGGVKQIVYNIRTQRLNLMGWIAFYGELYRNMCYKLEVWSLYLFLYSCHFPGDFVVNLLA